VSSSEPPELPEPEVHYRRPAWVEPPADMVPGIAPVELILARTPQRAIGLSGIRAYPTGFGCTLHLRLREDIPGEQSTFGAFNMFGDGVDPGGRHDRNGGGTAGQCGASRLRAGRCSQISRSGGAALEDSERAA
jgi:hypothetical protein